MRNLRSYFNELGFPLAGETITSGGRKRSLPLASSPSLRGKTGMVVARWHQRFVHLPMSLVTRGRRKVDPNGDLWRSVVELTGQPAKMGV
jgi:hypothetical protein